jgi:hypothetical protein
MSQCLEEVVKLLEACKNAGVSRIKWEKLDITFDPSASATAPAQAALPKSNPNRDQIEREIEEDPDLSDLELQTLMINDPEAFEDYLRKAQNVKNNIRSQRDVFPQ